MPLIMGISYALYEEKHMDPFSGRMLNANMESYKLAGLADLAGICPGPVSKRTIGAAASFGMSEAATVPQQHARWDPRLMLILVLTIS